MNKASIVIIISLIISVNLFGQVDNKQMPVPVKTKERLFYIQRNLNKNTIIYDANFDRNGNLDSNEPVKVYWLRFEENGKIMPLRTVEKNFVFGVSCINTNFNKNEYTVQVAAYKKRTLMLKQIAPYKAVIYIKIGDNLSVLNHVYVKANYRGLLSKIYYVELFGKQQNNNADTYEKIVFNENLDVAIKQ